MEWWLFPLLAGAGIVAGFLNVMAGGGSLLTMPILIFLGLEPAAANGTNRVAILVQNITAVGSFRQRGFSDWPLSFSLSLCTVPGAVVGAVAAIAIDPVIFKRILAGVLIAALALILGRRSNLGTAGHEAHPVWAHLAAGTVGFYGGFMQAGVGFLLMPILQRLLALDLVRVNMHKVFIVGVYTVPSLLVFAVKGHVWWLAGLVLAAGNAVGASIGAQVTVSRGERVIRAVFTLAVLAMAARLMIG
jgi:uncharacterized membrane protein YfcA